MPHIDLNVAHEMLNDCVIPILHKSFKQLSKKNLPINFYNIENILPLIVYFLLQNQQVLCSLQHALLAGAFSLQMDMLKRLHNLYTDSCQQHLDIEQRSCE